MGKKPVNAVKGQQGFQDTGVTRRGKTAVPTPADQPALHSAEANGGDVVASDHTRSIIMMATFLDGVNAHEPTPVAAELADLDTWTADVIAQVRAGGEETARAIEAAAEEGIHATPSTTVSQPGQWDDLAATIAAHAHHGQRDKSGVPYLLHPHGVATVLRTLPEYHALTREQQMHAVAAAYLHDVLEDTHLTEQDLRDLGFPKEVIDAVTAVTAPDGMPKGQYYAQVTAAGPVARAVKLADLGHNNLPSRRATLPGASGMPVPDGAVDQFTRLGKKYAKAYRALGADVPAHLEAFSER